jgi:hypothetical protein
LWKQSSGYDEAKEQGNRRHEFQLLEELNAGLCVGKLRGRGTEIEVDVSPAFQAVSLIEIEQIYLGLG